MLLYFNDTEIFSTDLRKILKYQSEENPSSGSRVFFMRTDGRTDMTKLIVAFRNFAKSA